MRDLGLPIGAARRLAAGVVIVLTLAGGARAQELPTDAEGFTAAVARLYRETSPGVETRIVGPLELAVKSARGEEIIYLNRIFLACANHRESCAALVAQQVAAIKGGLGPSSPTVSADILITVRPSAYVDEIVANAPESEDHFFVVPKVVE